MENQAQETVKGPSVELTVNDLLNLRSIVDVAVKRGAFNATEISSVGSVYDKLNNFLNAVTSPKPEQESTPEQETQE